MPPSSQTAMTYEWRQVLDGELHLIIGLDIGTKFSSACWSPSSPGAILAPGHLHKTKNIRVGPDHRISTDAAIVPSDDGMSARLVFGPDVEANLGLRTIEEKNVFRLLKLCLWPSGEETALDDVPSISEEDALMMAVTRKKHQVALNSAPTRIVTVSYGFEKTRKVRKLSTVKDVFREYLRYLCDKVKLDIQRWSSLATEDLQKIFRSKTTVAIAVPAIWSDPMIDQLRGLLADTGYSKFRVVSEPKCAAAVFALVAQSQIFDISNLEDQHQAMEALRRDLNIIVDIGHGTADLTTCRIREISPKLKVTTPFAGTGSLWGAHQLNIFFKDMVKFKLRHKLPDILEHLGSQMQNQVGGGAAPPDVFFDPLVRYFEKYTKVDFGIDCVDDMIVTFETDMTLPTMRGLGVGEKFITLSSGDMAEIFDDYISHIKGLIDDQISSITSRHFATEQVKIILVGGVSLSPYLRSQLQQAYPGRAVMCQEEIGYSMVAKGAFLASVDSNLGRREFARMSYGALYGLQYDPKIHEPADAVRTPGYFWFEWEVRDTMQWAIKKWQDLVNPVSPVIIEGHHYIEEEDIEWPLELEQVIYKSKDENVCLQEGFKFVPLRYPTIHCAGTLTMKIQHRDCTLKIQRQAGKRFLEIETRAIPRWDGVVMYWQYVAHQSGKFPNRNFADLGDCIVVEMVLEDALRYQELEIEG